ncbi:MAG: carboxypeptidase regulatory-like domain-containing protein [Terriglobia bacterium]
MKKIFVMVTVFLFAAAILADAQAVGTIAGTVTDTSGAVVPSAKVVVTAEGTGVSTTAISNARGYYVLPSLRPTTYNLSVQKNGFRTYLQKGVILLANQSATVDVTLQVGQTTQQVTVTGAPPLVDTTTPTVAQVIGAHRMVDLPLNGRNAAQLTLLVPGIEAISSSNPSEVDDQGITKTFPEVQLIAVNGTDEGSTSYFLDGANNVDEYTDVNDPFPFPDALQEFSVQTSNYSAKFGNNAGGVVNIVTKSGTNQVHGDAFEFVRNAVFNGRNFFAADRDQLKRNQFGGTIGGPVVIPGVYNGHDKTFFFFGYQGTRVTNVTGGSSAFVPTSANINGDFSALLDATNPDNPLGKAITVVNPATGQPYPGNIIPTTSFDPASVNFLKYLPRASGNGQVFFTEPGIVQNYNEFIGRVDHQISSKDRLTGRFFYDRFSNAPFFEPSNILTYKDGSTIIALNSMIHETHIFRPNLVNDLHLTYLRTASSRGPAPGEPSVADLGVKNIYQPPGISMIESLNVKGFFDPSADAPALFARNSYNVADDVSYILGRNTIGFGGSFDRSQVTDDNHYREPGEFEFTGDVTNYAVASFLLGYLRQFQQGAGEFNDTRNNFLGLYVEDNIHATRRLTLDAGVRWEPAWPWEEIRGRRMLFEPNNYYAGIKSNQFLNAPPGLLYPGDPGMPPQGIHGSLNNWEPRLGFADDVFGNGRTSLRGGVGMFYDTRAISENTNLFVDSDPWSPQLSVVTPQGPFSNPLLGLVNPFPAVFPPPKDALFPAPVSVITYDPSRYLKVPLVYQWNLQIEHQFAHELMLRAAYVGSHGFHLHENVDLNPAVYIPGSTLGTDQRRVYQGYSDIMMDGQDAWSSYNSLQLTAQKRLASGGFLSNMSVLANYTYSKSLDDVPYEGSGALFGCPGYASTVPWGAPGRHQMDTGPSYFDRTQNFIVSYVWNLPSLEQSSRAIRSVFGGWQFTGILTLQTGDPLTIVAGEDLSMTGLEQDRAVQVGPAFGPGACGTSAPCVNDLNPNAFVLPATGTYGDTGKGSLYGPGYSDWDMGLFKDIALKSERYHLQLRGEFFNTFNWANFQDPINAVSSGGFGSITSANDPRIIQLAAKFIF